MHHCARYLSMSDELEADGDLSMIELLAGGYVSVVPMYCAYPGVKWDWGDGSVENIASGGEHAPSPHTYEVKGDRHTIRISGRITSIRGDMGSPWLQTTYPSKLYCKDIFMGRALTEIGSYAFRELYFRSFVGHGVMTVGNYGFMKAEELETCDIPNVQTIGDQAFQSCKNLMTMRMRGGCNIGTRVFQGCVKFRELDINSPSVTMGTGVIQASGSASSEIVVRIRNAANPGSPIAFNMKSDSLAWTMCPVRLHLPGMTMAQARAITNYPFGLETGSTVICSDGTITR